MNTILDVLEGRARWCIVEGDALAALRSVPSHSVDAVVVDAPYSSGGFTRGDRSVDAKSKYSKGQLADFGGDNRDQLGFHHWCAIWYGDALRASKPGAPIVTFTDWRQLPVTTNAIQAGGWVWRGIAPWDKGDACRPQMGRFRSQCEFAVWGTNGASPDLEAVGCLPGLVRANPPPSSTRVHLTQKPLEVMLFSVAICAPGGVVLDPFCGSASTGVAALRTGRRFVGFERDPHYAQVARERLAAEAEGLSIQDARAGQASLFGSSTDST